MTGTECVLKMIEQKEMVERLSKSLSDGIELMMEKSIDRNRDLYKIPISIREIRRTSELSIPETAYIEELQENINKQIRILNNKFNIIEKFLNDVDCPLRVDNKEIEEIE